MKYLNKKQIDSVLAKASESSNRDYVIVVTLLHSGLRVSELLSLTPQNINFEAKYIAIKGKGGKIRNIDVSPFLLQQLKMYVNVEKTHTRDQIFTVTRQRVHQITKELSGMNPHAFRHTYAINLLRKTGNIRYVQKQLGHTSISTTQTYLQFVEYDKEKETLQTLFEG